MVRDISSATTSAIIESTTISSARIAPHLALQRPPRKPDRRADKHPRGSEPRPQSHEKERNGHVLHCLPMAAYVVVRAGITSQPGEAANCRVREAGRNNDSRIEVKRAAQSRFILTMGIRAGSNRQRQAEEESLVDPGRRQACQRQGRPPPHERRDEETEHQPGIEISQPPSRYEEPRKRRKRRRAQQCVWPIPQAMTIEPRNQPQSEQAPKPGHAQIQLARQMAIVPHERKEQTPGNDLICRAFDLRPRVVQLLQRIEGPMAIAATESLGNPQAAPFH